MSNPDKLTDEDLAAIVTQAREDATVLEETMDGDEIASIALELQGYRTLAARVIESHRAERAATDRLLAALREDIPAMVAEAHRTRLTAAQAADRLTPEEVEQVRSLLLSLDGEPRAMRSALEKVLAAHGAKP